MHVGQGDRSELRVLTPKRNVYLVLRDIRTYDVVRACPRVGNRPQSEAVPLPDGVERGTLVLADYLAVTKHLSRHNCDEALKKFSHGDISDETQPLAVGFLRDRQVEFARERAHVRFQHTADGEYRACEVKLRETIQKVRLVFRKVAGAYKLQMAADFPFARVVAGRYRVRALRLRPLRERAEFYVLVAQNVGIRGNALRVVPYHPLDNFPFVFLRKVNFTKRDAKRGADAQGV